MFLMIACPWHIMQSRFGLDCNLLSSMVLISITSLTFSKKWWHFFITGILFGITLYTYALSYIIIPILLLLTLSYMLYTKKIKFINIIVLGIPIFLLALPLILMILVNMGYINQINSFITIPKLFSFRGQELSFDNIIGNLKQFKIIITHDSFIYNSIAEFGTIYLFAIPLCISGLLISILETIKAIIKREFTITSIMLFLFIANMFLMCLTNINVNKINSIYISLIYFVFLTIKKLFIHSKISFFIIISIYFIMFLTFLNYYFNKYNIVNAYIDLVDNNTIELVQEIEKIDKNKTVYMHLNIHQPWIYVLHSLQLSPYEFNNTKRENNIKNYANNYSFGRYYFELPDEIIENSLYVINPDEFTRDFCNELIKNDYNFQFYKNVIIFYKN